MSVLKNLDLNRVYRNHCVRSVITTLVKTLSVIRVICYYQYSGSPWDMKESETVVGRL